VIIDCSRHNESIKSAIVNVRIEFDCKENVPMNTTAYYLILHDRVVQYNPLTNVAKLPKCDTTLFPEDDIKIYDASKSTVVFSRTESCLYQYLWICKISSLEDILSLKSLLLSKRDIFFLIIFLDAPYRGVASPKRKDTRLIENCHGIQWEDGSILHD